MTKTIDTLIAALTRAARLNNEGYWTHIEYPYQETACKLEYGAVHTNGERERAICTTVFMASRDGVVVQTYTRS